MTPDELRRLDNDLCIVFEKGIKPVKANKFYYFKHKNMFNSLKNAEISHNDIGEIKRGNWRKFNPYNPWTEDKSEKEAQDLQVESLDDLFNDDEVDKDNDKTTQTENKTSIQNDNKKVNQNVESLDDMFEEEEKTEGTERKKAPVIADEEDSYDLQKELEAKFDELFGPIDEE